MTKETNPNIRRTTYWLAALRSLRFQLLPQLTTWKRTQEPKKTAAYRDRKAASLRTLLHLVPLAATLALVILNFKTKYIGIVPPLLTPIQFASKLLEILIQASIATTVLGLVRNQVLGPLPFPFGGLIAPLRNDRCIVSLVFGMWGCLSSSSLRGWRKVAILATLPMAVVLTTLVGPASAVLMIPRPVQLPHDHYLELLNRSDLVYPSNVDLVNGHLR